MDQVETKKIRWNYVLAGGLMLIFDFYITDFSYIFDWSTTELVGFNLWALFTVGICGSVIYKGFKY